MKQVRQQACKTHTPPYGLKQRRRPQFRMTAKPHRLYDRYISNVEGFGKSYNILAVDLQDIISKDVSNCIHKVSTNEHSTIISRELEVLNRQQVLIFTARRNARIASAVLATAIPSVYPSVRLSHAGRPIVSKRRHV